MTANLSPEQVRLISVYWEKWQSMTRSTRPIDRQKATDAVHALYQLAVTNQPEVIFVDHPLPYYAQAFLRSETSYIQEDGSLEQHLKSNPENIFIRDHQENIAVILAAQLKLPVERLSITRLKTAFAKIKQGKSRYQAFLEADAEVYSVEDNRQLELLQLVNQQFHQQYGTEVSLHLFVPVESSWMGDTYRVLYEHLDLPQELKFQIADQGSRYFHGVDVGCLDCSILAFACARFDYCVSVLDFPADSRWQVLHSLVQECGSMLFPYQDFCIVCDRLYPGMCAQSL